MHSGQWFMRRKFLNIYQNFHYFDPDWDPKGASPFIWTNLNPYSPDMFPTKFGWNWPSGSWEEIVWRKIMTPDGRTTDDGRMTDAAPWHKLSWSLTRWAKNIEIPHKQEEQSKLKIQTTIPLHDIRKGQHFCSACVTRHDVPYVVSRYEKDSWQ